MLIKKSSLFRFLSDKTYIKLKYFIRFKRRINLTNPKTFNEKVNWLKLYDRKDIYTIMVDKYEAKRYVSNIIGDKYIIPTYGIYNSFNEIDFNMLPNQFVIKCTHDSGGLVVVKNKKYLNIENAKKIIEKSLNSNYYYDNREWPYKNVKPRIIIEKYMEDEKTNELRDYKFFCFDGKPKIMFIAFDRAIHKTKFNFYDMDFNMLNFKQHYPNFDIDLIKPKTFEKMKKIAAKLSKGIPHLRVDLYEINGKIYFGELTFSHFGGFVPFDPKEWDLKLGKMLDISKVGEK